MSSRPAGPIMDMELQLRGPLAATLEAEAKKRRLSPAELAADVLEAVIGDNLFAAVLE